MKTTGKIKKSDNLLQIKKLHGDGYEVLLFSAFLMLTVSILLPGQHR